MKFNRFIFGVLLIFFGFYSISVMAEEEVIMSEENLTCLKCHANKHYTFFNKVTEKNERKLMNPYFLIDTINFLMGEHKYNYCIDCHSSDYEAYPHNGELKLEPKMRCMDCHDFEAIGEEVRKSVHYEAYNESFQCEHCHDPHSNKLVKTDMSELIAYNNHRCLNCHDDRSKYQIFTSEDNPQILETHEWLPNQVLHFEKIRCIECHTLVTDTADAIHNIVSKDLAVKNCSECHSKNSLLRDKLYKHQIREGRQYNFYRSYILNDAYVIGANRNFYVNLITLIIFGMTLTGIIIHIVLRIMKGK